MKVLIVDEGRDRASVAAARALVATGWTVGVGLAPMRRRAWPRARVRRGPAPASCTPTTATRRSPTASSGSCGRTVTTPCSPVGSRRWWRCRRAGSGWSSRLGYGRHDGILTAIDKWRLRAAGAGGRPRRAQNGAGDARGPRASSTAASWSSRPRRLTHGVAAAVFEARDAALAHARRIEALGGQAIAQEQLDGRLAAVSLVAGPDGILSIAQQVAEHAWPRPVGVTAAGGGPRRPGAAGAIERLLDALAGRASPSSSSSSRPDGTPS